MKKLFTLFLLCSSLQAFGQLSLFKEIDDELYSFQLSSGEWMFSTLNREKNKLKSITLLKGDLSVYKIINIDQKFPFDTTGYSSNQIGIDDIELSNGISIEFYFSDHFINGDDKIEFIVSYRSSSNINNSISGQKVLIVMNEDGKEIQRFTNNLGEEISLDFSKYLFVGFYDSKKYTESFKLFSVPGSLPCLFTCSQKAAAITPISPANEFKEIQVNGFPNPSSDKVTLAYTLPEGVSFGTLKLYTQTGELVKEFKVSSQMDHLELPVSDYTPGTYYYELQAGGNTSGGKKMVVIH